MKSTGAWRVLGVVVLAAASVRGIVDVSNYCQDVPEDGYYCATCLHAVYCSSQATTLLETCLDEVCDGNQGYSACVPMEDAVHCQCDSPTQCDSYNPTYVNKCNDDGMYDVFACEAEQTCSGGNCEGEVPGVHSCEDVGALYSDWNIIIPDCTQGFYCYEDGTQFSVQCEADEYIDTNGNCLARPPLPCASGCTGPCPDNLDCTQYYYCHDSGAPLDITQCPEGQFFDPNAEPVPMCQGDPSRCAPLTYCDFDVTLVQNQQAHRHPHIAP